MYVMMPTFSGVDILLPREINLRGCDTLALVMQVTLTQRYGHLF